MLLLKLIKAFVTTAGTVLGLESKAVRCIKRCNTLEPSPLLQGLRGTASLGCEV